MHRPAQLASRWEGNLIIYQNYNSRSGPASYNSHPNNQLFLPELILFKGMDPELELFVRQWPWPLGDLSPLFCCFPAVDCECPPVMFFRVVDNLGDRDSQWIVVSASVDLLVALPDTANLLQAPDCSLCACGILFALWLQLQGSLAMVSIGDSIS